MASSVEKVLAKHLECGICLEKFEDPKVLRCQHLYCKKCLEKLVTRDEITCPECRRKTEVPSGDVESLPTNFLINNLLSIRGNNQSNASQSCEKHDGEILKLFCQTCDQLICRDCAVIDHRDHRYSFIKDIFPAVKEKIVGTVQKSKAKIRDLESSIKTIKEQEDDMHKNFVKKNFEIDSFIDKEIGLLERKRKSMKDDQQKLISAKKKQLYAQMESFQTSLSCLKSRVEFTEEALTRGCQVEIMSAKNQMIQQLIELNSAPVLTDLPPTKIGEYDHNYELCLTTDKISMTNKLRSASINLATFYICHKVFCPKLLEASKVQVTVIAPDCSLIVQVPVSNNRDGSFKFDYKPDKFGHYLIEVLINGRSVYGSPFTWEVVKSSP
ncbi:hypothetical protein ACROYT_G035064 [Oculina patagonica]